jgi:hypothetical protein
MDAGDAPLDLEVLFAELTPQEAFAAFAAHLGLAQGADALSRSRFFDQLARVAESQSFSPDWLSALFAVSPAFLKRGPDSGLSARACSGRLSEAVVKNIERATSEERQILFESLIENLKDVSLLTALMRPEEGGPRIRELFGDAATAIESRLIARIETLAATGGLWQQVMPQSVLWFWWAAQEDKVYAFVKVSMKDKTVLPILLDMIVEPGSGESETGDSISVRRWSKIIDFQGLETQALQLALTGTSREERRRARRFLDAFGNGKSELFR